MKTTIPFLIALMLGGLIMFGVAKYIESVFEFAQVEVNVH